MHLISKKTLELFIAQGYASARPGIEKWVTIAKAATWVSQEQIVWLGVFEASPIGRDRVVFNIGGNNFRIVCAILFARPDEDPPVNGTVFVKWIGTHAEYDRIDPATVEYRR